MSQFDYPRLNFHGHAYINSATGNNCFYLPLVIYDPLNVEVVIPPKLYVSEANLVADKTMRDVKAILPPGNAIQVDLTGMYAGIPYVDIESISTDELFKEWAKTPLGECFHDQAYWELYNLFEGEKTGQPLTGSIPGYWNYYGNMGYWFEGVRIGSIALFDKEKGESIHTTTTPDCPEDISQYLGHNFSMRQRNPDGHEYNTGIMIDTEPTFSAMTQVFCNCMRLEGNDLVAFSGKPVNAPCRYLNPFRIINEDVPLNSSATFITTIRTEDLEEKEKSSIIELFKKYGNKDPSKLKGVFIVHNLFEIGEDRPPDYLNDGEVMNPAKGTLVGNITPWYDDDELRTIKVARQLNGSMPLLMRNKFVPPVIMFPPTPFEIDYKHHFITLDFLNSIPETNVTFGEKGGDPRADTSYAYETMDIGELELGVTDQNGDTYPISKFRIDKSTYSRRKLLRESGMIKLAFKYQDGLTEQKLRDGSFYIKGKGFDPAKKKMSGEAWLMKESRYTILTDQAALYVDQYSDPSKGYRCSSGQREPCVLRIFDRGVSVTEPIQITPIKYEYHLEGDGSCQVTLLQTDSYKDGDVFTVHTDRAGGTIYEFVPGRMRYTLAKNAMNVLSTGFYAVLRVLARKNYARYLDPGHPLYPTEVTWDVLYREIFRTYELIYPCMAKSKLPFRKEIWDNPIMAGELVKAISEDNWQSSMYMPFTRELSWDQVELIHKWAEKFKSEQEDDAYDIKLEKSILQQEKYTRSLVKLDDLNK